MLGKANVTALKSTIGHADIHVAAPKGTCCDGLTWTSTALGGLSVVPLCIAAETKEAMAPSVLAQLSLHTRDY